MEFFIKHPFMIEICFYLVLKQKSVALIEFKFLNIIFKIENMIVYMINYMISLTDPNQCHQEIYKNIRPLSDSEAATMYKLKGKSSNMRTGQGFK